LANAETAAHITRKMSVEEFLQWLDEDTWAEWKGGEVIVLSPASRSHQQLVHFLANLLDEWAQGTGGTVLFAPFPLKLHLPDGDIRVREPDILFVSKQNAAQLQETFAESPIDLVIEVTSEESRARDRSEKFAEYEAAGIGEYWIIDPDNQLAEFYQLQPEGRFALALPDAEGIYESSCLPGFRLRVDWLWRTPRPRPSQFPSFGE
jgi:Uma2 family endonuclease